MKTLGLKWISVALFAGAILFAGCGSSSSNGTGGTGGSPAATVSFSGIAWAFELPGAPYGRISGAKVSILEMPELETTTNADGEFTIEGLHVGSQATLVLEHESHPLTYTKTHTVPDTDLDDLTFQIPTNFLFGLIESGLVDGGVIDGIDPNKCQVVSTFTRFGKTIGDSGHHGEPGAILSVAPANNAEAGPIYFGDDVIPDPTRAYSSLDGGVLLINVEPGDYTLSASCVPDPTDLIAEYPPEDNDGESLRCQTEDVQFESILMKCQPGVFLNASPSYGLQALAPE
ncbi:MAG: carboxypeptidase regulatory-like domain-containing protein [Deltaproteobacteria bacterium]|nr:carboxypeptidase regulatory-like domain-containing protein [Deltaproteobacteria bacterium]